MLEVDDTDPFIFTSGQWKLEQLTDPAVFRGTTTVTAVAGAYKTIRFTGTSILAYGPIGASAEPSTRAVGQFSIDNGSPATWTAPRAGVYIPSVLMYSSGDLPMGEHVLTMRNMLGGATIGIDIFIIRGPNGGPEPALLRSDGAQVPSNPNPAPVTSPRTTPTSATATRTVSGSGSTSLVTSGTTPSTLPSNTSTLSNLTTNNTTSAPISSSSAVSGPAAPMTTYQSTVINADDPQDTSSPRNVPAIALGTCGALLIVLIIAVLVVIRRRNRQRTTSAPESPEGVEPYPSSHSDSSQDSSLSTEKRSPMDEVPRTATNSEATSFSGVGLTTPSSGQSLRVQMDGDGDLSERDWEASGRRMTTSTLGLTRTNFERPPSYTPYIEP